MNAGEVAEDASRRSAQFDGLADEKLCSRREVHRRPARVDGTLNRSRVIGIVEASKAANIRPCRRIVRRNVGRFENRQIERTRRLRLKQAQRRSRNPFIDNRSGGVGRRVVFLALVFDGQLKAARFEVANKQSFAGRDRRMGSSKANDPWPRHGCH